MKSLNSYITEKRNTTTVEFDGSPNWGIMTPAITEGGDVCIIIGEPCSRKRQDAWTSAIDTAKKIGVSTKWVDNKIEDAFKTIEQDLGEELDVQECLCLTYLPEDGTLTVYVYQNGGVYAIK